MGEFGRQSSYTNNDRGVSTKIFKGTNTTFGTPFRDLHLGKNGSSVGRVHSGLARVGSDKRDHISNVASFFDNILQIKEKWEKTSDNRSVETERLARYPDIQDGNGSGDSEIHYEKSLGVLCRYKGCVFTRPDKLGFSQIPSIQSEKQDFCFSVSSVRSLPCSLGLHKSDGANKEETSHVANPDLQLSGRFHHFRSLSVGIVNGSERNLAADSVPRPYNKLGEIQPGAFPNRGVSGGLLGSQGLHIVSSPRQEEHDRSSLSVSRSGSVRFSENVGESVGAVEFRSNLLFCMWFAGIARVN